MPVGPTRDRDDRRGPDACRQDLLSAARDQLERATAVRRRLHRQPEIGNHLPMTRAAVLDSIEGLGLDLTLSEQSSGLIATLRGSGSGRSVLLRADMDALAMPEDTDLEYRSEIEGRMHACGHDAHVGMLVAAAHLLAERKATLPGDVHFLFQPGEEGHFGARVMLEEGLLDGAHRPDAVFALHVEPRLHMGWVASRPGPLLASADVWNVEITGRGGHASMPHSARDPIPVACEIVTGLQTMVTRRIEAFDPVVLTTTQLRAGTANNVIPEKAYVTGTLRATSERARMAAQEGIHRIVHGISQAHGVDAKVDIEAGYPVTVNDADFARFARDVAVELVGEECFVDMPSPIMGAEDFSYLLHRFPGAMVFLGLRDPENEHPAPCHSNRMTIGEEGMAYGIALHAAVALRFLERR